MGESERVSAGATRSRMRDFELSVWMRIRDSKQNGNFYDFLNSHETYENQSKALIKKLFWRYIWRYRK